MKFTAYAKPAVGVLFVSSLLASSLVSAQWGGGNNNNNTGGGKSGTYKSYSLTDYINYLSNFSKIPSKYSWDEVESTPQSSPERDVPAVPAPSPAQAPPEANPPPCLSNSPYASYSDIYNGTCASNSPQLPYVSDVGYEGTKCSDSLSEVHVFVQPASGSSIERDIRLIPPTRNQYEVVQADGTLVVNCSEFTDSAGNKITIGGKQLVGSVTYRCQAGVWRVMSINCTDKMNPCPAASRAFTAISADGMSYTTPTVAIPQTDVGAYATVGIACTSLPAPGGSMKWEAGTIGIYCDGAQTFQIAQNVCKKVAIPSNLNTTYPNCTGANTLYYPDIKPGFDMCMTADGAKYYWMLTDGYPVTQCADTFNGCVAQ